MTDRSMQEIEEMNGAKYINPYTDFGFKKERQDYEDSLKIYRDMKNVLDTAEMRGLEKGLEKGRKEGLEKGVEKGMEKVRGMSADDIAKL